MLTAQGHCRAQLVLYCNSFLGHRVMPKSTVTHDQNKFQCSAPKKNIIEGPSPSEHHTQVLGITQHVTGLLVSIMHVRERAPPTRQQQSPTMSISICFQRGKELDPVSFLKYRPCCDANVTFTHKKIPRQTCSLTCTYVYYSNGVRE